MSAKLETFFELKKVVDHDCGNYQIGEIDFVPYNKLTEYVNQYGEDGYRNLVDVCIQMMEYARNQMIMDRMNKQSAGVAKDSQ